MNEGQRWLMLRRWKYADRVTLLMWASKVKVRSLLYKGLGKVLESLKEF